MKNSAFIKNSVFAALAVAAMNMLSSCESCSRKDDAGHDDDMAPCVDTVYIDTCMSPNDTLVESSGGVYVPRGQKSGTGTGNATGSTGTTSGGNKGSTLTEEQITDRVENSGQAVKNGKPINSGGTSGTGQGTGTGSTGNNSRVTT